MAMNHRGKLIALLVALALLAVGCGGTQSSRTKTEPAHAPTNTEIGALGNAPISYHAALSSLDQFLGAWLSGDASRAQSLLTPGLHNILDGGEARNTFLGKHGGQPEAFEVIGSQQVSASEYRFKVWIYRFVPGAYSSDYVVPRAKPDIVLVRKSGNPWLVATIPEEILRR